MMSEQKTWVRFVAEWTIVGRNYAANEVEEFSRATARELFKLGVAVPCAGPGRMLTSDSVGTARSARRAA